MSWFDWLFSTPPRTTLQELNRHREEEDRIALERQKEANRHREAMAKLRPGNAWHTETTTTYRPVRHPLDSAKRGTRPTSEYDPKPPRPFAEKPKESTTHE